MLLWYIERKIVIIYAFNETHPNPYNVQQESSNVQD
jgi:hypothetical protein